MQFASCFDSLGNRDGSALGACCPSVI